MIKAVIFDMDGILFDTERLAVQSWEKAGQDMGIKGMGDVVPFVLGLNDTASLPYVMKVVGDHPFDYADFRARAKAYSFAHFEKYGVPIKDGVRIALSYLKENGYKTAVGTSTIRETAMHHFEQTGLKEYFDAFACGDEIKNSKPAPDVFLLAAERLGVSPECCLVMEDSPNGIKAAAAAGMAPVMVPDLAQPTDEIKPLIAYQLISLAQPPNLLQKLKK